MYITAEVTTTAFNSLPILQGHHFFPEPYFVTYKIDLSQYNAPKLNKGLPNMHMHCAS